MAANLRDGFQEPAISSNAVVDSPPSKEDPAFGSGKTLSRNALLNLIGLGAPLLVAVFAIPALDAGLGTERYGLLLIAWMVLGYFSLFDLGLSRALTQLLADRLGQGATATVPGLIWTAVLLTLGLGLLGSLLLVLLTPWLLHDVLDVAPALYDDVRWAFYALALAVPFITSTISLRGVLEAYQRFDLVNAIRLPFGIFMFAGPLLVLPFFPTLLAVVLVLVVGRIVAWGAHLYCCGSVLPALRRRMLFDSAAVAPLLRFGGWMTVSNLVSPLMVYLDRLLIGALLSATAVAYYATPWEAVTKLLLLPAAIVAVLFPSFSFLQHRDASQLTQLFLSGTKAVLLGLFPLALLAIVLAHPVLDLWLGPLYAAQSTRPLQILAIGVLLNGVSHIPFAFLQGLGRPDLTAKLHLLELPFYLVALFALIHLYGLAGAAVAWVFRAALDLTLLMHASHALLHRTSRYAYRRVVGAIVASVLLAVFVVLGRPPLVRMLGTLTAFREEALLLLLGLGGAMVYGLGIVASLKVLGVRLARS